MVDVSVTIGQLRLRNPVMPASGTFGYGEEFADLLNLEELGAVIVKGISLKPRLGSFEHRFVEIAGSASLSTIGLQNVGVHRFIEDKLPYLRKFKTPVIVNIAGESVGEFVQITDLLSHAAGVHGLQVNLNCPNVKEGGMSFSADPQMAFDVLKAVRNATGLTLIAKLLPSLTDITTLAKVCEKAGADAIRPSAGRIGMAIDIHTRRSKLGRNLTGAVLGPTSKPVAVRMVWQVAQAVKLPIVGGGGIMGPDDALEFLIAGATAVEIGTAALIDPSVFTKTIEGIKDYLANHGMGCVEDLIGSMIVPEMEFSPAQNPSIEWSVPLNHGE